MVRSLGELELAPPSRYREVGGHLGHCKCGQEGMRWLQRRDDYLCTAEKYYERVGVGEIGHLEGPGVNSGEGCDVASRGHDRGDRWVPENHPW